MDVTKKGSLRRAGALLLSVLLLILGTVPGVFGFTAVNHKNWKQYDSQWGGQMIVGRTIKQAGCLATSVAILAVEAGVANELTLDPGSFVTKLKLVGGFDANDTLIWDKIDDAIPGFTSVYPWTGLSGSAADKAAAIAGYISQGYYVCVAVQNQGHWVAVESAGNGSVQMMDPASENGDLFGMYDAAGVTRCALLRKGGGSGLLEQIKSFFVEIWNSIAAIFNSFALI